MQRFRFAPSRALIVKLPFIVAIIYAGSVQVFPQSIRKIAITYGGGAGSTHVAVVNEDGSGLVELTSGNADRDPSWSPDGKHIVYSGERLGGTNIIRMNADGTGQIALTDTQYPLGNSEPVWSPDGKKIAFVSSRAGAGRSEIWVMNADGTNSTRLTINPQFAVDAGGPVYGKDFGPRWSPDGTKIVFWTTRLDLGNSEIYVMNADGTNPVRLTKNSANDSEPVWSRDGNRIAFFSRGVDREGVYEIDATGGNERWITNGVPYDWSPDGQRLAITDFDPSAHNAMAVYAVNADGTNRIRITNTGEIDSRTPVWQTLGGPAPPPPPGGPLFTVTGKVSDTSINPGGTGLSGITVSLMGSMSASTTTDANGNFSFANLPENGTFTLTPSNSAWSFFPTSSTFSTSAPLVGFIGKNIDVRFTAAPIFLQFTSDTYEGSEGATAMVTVERVGFTTGTSTVKYWIDGGTATNGGDYLVEPGTLTFNPGEATKSFPVRIAYDKLVEPVETISFFLDSPTGATVRGRQRATMNVSDPAPRLLLQPNSNLAAAVNAEMFVHDPFARTAPSIFGPDSPTGPLAPRPDAPTRIALFLHYVDLVAGENYSAVKVIGIDSNQISHDLPVEYVGRPTLAVDLTQINIRLPAGLPVGDLYLIVSLRGRSSELGRIRIQ